MKCISIFVSWDDIEGKLNLKFMVMHLINDMTVNLVRSGVKPENVFTSIRLRVAGLLFEVWGE